MTGQLPPVNKSDDEPPSRDDSPQLGALLSKFRDVPLGLPASVTMPWKTFHPAAPGGESPGQSAGWLGPVADPMLVTGDPNLSNWSVPALQLLDGLDTQRLDHRRALLASIDRQQQALTDLATLGMTTQQEQAFRLLSSHQIRNAFDLVPQKIQPRATAMVATSTDSVCCWPDACWNTAFRLCQSIGTTTAKIFGIRMETTSSV